MKNTEVLAQSREVKDPPPPEHGDQVKQPEVLYITLRPDGAFKVGTCPHCVIEEQGRPERAWDADGDKDLDFDRDTLFAHLKDLGIVFTYRQAYVCP